MIAETASPAWSVVGEDREQRSHRGWGAQDPQRQRRRDAERSLGADQGAEQIGALIPERQLDDSPSGSTISAASTWLTVKPYFRQCAPPEFSAALPPIVQTCCEEGSGA